MAAPGWYPDADDPYTTRYWDGSGWIAQRRWDGTGWVDAPVQPSAPEHAPAAVQPVTDPDDHTPVVSKKLLVAGGTAVAIMLVVALAVVSSILSGGGGSGSGGSGVSASFCRSLGSEWPLLHRAVRDGQGAGISGITTPFDEPDDQRAELHAHRAEFRAAAAAATTLAATAPRSLPAAFTGDRVANYVDRDLTNIARGFHAAAVGDLRNADFDLSELTDANTGCEGDGLAGFTGRTVCDPKDPEIQSTMVGC